MNKKTLFQLVLIFFLILIVFLFYKIFFVTKPQIQETKIESEITDLNKELGSNIIENLKYSSEDIFGNIYTIQAKSAEIASKDEQVIKLIEVESTIDSENQETIYIYSNYADYNRINNNTVFSEKVKIEYDRHLINSDVIVLDFKKNLIEILENVHYMSLNTEIFADKIEIDIISKKLKLSMNNKSKEILVKGKY
ncbi:hypothetical protein IDG86_02895 [Pelagibacterales bacterium SAG-MED13]|nr:hypothetical protein [Pelagibacterales bacterium SAG-MED13]|tara:strand:- start:137 stop:721 length:585 start_codon:yes stop_codon:yes gene_type:complete